MIVPGGGFLLPSSRVPGGGGKVLDETDTCISTCLVPYSMCLLIEVHLGVAAVVLGGNGENRRDISLGRECFFHEVSRWRLFLAAWEV